MVTRRQAGAVLGAEVHSTVTRRQEGAAVCGFEGHALHAGESSTGREAALRGDALVGDATLQRACTQWGRGARPRRHSAGMGDALCAAGYALQTRTRHGARAAMDRTPRLAGTAGW